MTPPTTSDKAHRLRNVLIAALLLFVADLAVVIHEQMSGASGLTPLLHLMISALFLVILGYSIRRFPITPPTPHNANANYPCLSDLPIPAVLINRQGRICGVNPVAALSVKQSPSALMNQAAHDFFHPQQSSPKKCLLCQHISAGLTLAPTDFAMTKYHWQQISLSHIDAGNADQLLQLHVDISDRKRAEERMALVVDGAKLGYWDWDYVNGKHEVNRHWLDMLGLKPEDIQDTIEDWDQRIHPDDRNHVRDTVAKHISSNTPYVVEFRMRHKAGHWVWIQGSGAAVEHDPNTGQATRLCGTHQDITARKHFENNLQAAYQIISQSPSVVLKWHCSEGLPIAFATENVVQLFGYTEEELLGGKLFYLNLIHPEDQTLFTEEINSCRNKPDCTEITHLPYRIVTRNGKIKWVQDHKVLSRNDQGQVIGYQGLVTDITRQRQQNSAIRNIISSAQEKHSPWAMDNLTLLTAETLAADYTLIAEIQPDRNCRVLSFCSLNQTDDNSFYTLHSSICALLTAGKICSHPHSMGTLFPDDNWLINHGIDGFIGIPLQNDRRQTVGCVVAMYRQPISDPQFAEDIMKLFAAQITSELERSTAMKALETQKQRLIDAQSISHIGDWQWHWSDNRFSWSDEMYRITGTNRANFIPSYASILTQLIHPDDRNLFKTALQNASINETIDFQHRIILRHGEIRHVHQRGKVIHNDQGGAVGIQGTMQDITERLKTEQSLLEAKHAAEKATQVKSEFLANMSHEIRTPMNAIVGLVELCLNSPINAKQRDYLQRVENATHSLMTLIDDILDFSKMESGKLNLEPVPFLLEEMLDHVFSTMAELSSSKQITLNRPPITKSYPALIGDPQRLRQILINLIGNAIKFTQQGKIDVTLKEVERNAQQITLEFSIRDTGIGMSEDQQKRLFRAFTQGDGSVSRHYGGTGLGLVISKQLIEQMDGTISVTSEKNVGSCFSFTVKLGIVHDALGYQSKPETKNFDINRLQSIRHARILLVEDNEVNRIVATELLNQAQLQIDTAENGEEALAKLTQERYDCILMDVQMPVMDGYQATRELRQLPNGETVPVIAMTANVMADDRNKCLQAGMDDFIGKPILPNTLYSTLCKWIKPNAMETENPIDTSKDNDEIPNLYGIDSSIGLLHTAEDQSVFRKVLHKFAENHVDSMIQIRKALSKNDFESARQLVHTLKGLAGSIGAIQLQGHLIRLEESMSAFKTNTDDFKPIDKLMSLASVELDRVIIGIQTALPKVQDKSLRQAKPWSATEIQQQLEILLGKLRTFDSDADHQLDLILSNINQSALSEELNQVKKQISHYQFIEAAKALNQLLDVGISES